MRSPLARTLVSILGVLFVPLSGGPAAVCAQTVPPPSAPPPVAPPPVALPPSALPSPPSLPAPRSSPRAERPERAERTDRPARPELRYLDIVREYASGDYDTAMDAIVNFPNADLDRAFEAFQEFLVRPIGGGNVVLDEMNKAEQQKVAALWARLVPAAAVMHLEAGAFLLTFQKNDEGRDHLFLARALVDWTQWPWIVKRLPFERKPHEERRRSVYLAIAWTLQQFEQSDLLPPHLKKAREEFPNDAEVLLTSGSAEEMLTTPILVDRELSTQARGSVNVPMSTRRRMLRHSHLEKAEAYHRAAVHADPRLAEAHMRLGRVLQEQGQRAEARRSLETARDLKPPSDIGYLAALFLAGIADEEGDEASTFAQYDAIAKRWPDCQSGHLGLSRAYEARGDRQAALGALLPLWRARKERACPVDPWWIYGLGQAWRLEALRETLRAQVRVRS